MIHVVAHTTRPAYYLERRLPGVIARYRSTAALQVTVEDGTRVIFNWVRGADGGTLYVARAYVGCSPVKPMGGWPKPVPRCPVQH